MCDNLIKCKIATIINIMITTVYNSTHFSIQFTVSTINICISESHCSDSHKVPHIAPSIPCKVFITGVKKSCQKKLPLNIAILTIKSVHRKE